MPGQGRAPRDDRRHGAGCPCRRTGGPLPDGVRATVLDPFAGLSPRERRVAALVAEGATNSEIARTLRISEKTVRNQVCTIADKLGVRGRVGITIRSRGGGSGAGECPPSPGPPR